MRAQEKPFYRTSKAGWHLIQCLAILAFLCRAIVPAGYMPALSKAAGTTVVLTLCNADGRNEALRLVLPAVADASSDDVHVSQECPFGLVMSQGILPVQPPATVAAVVWQRPLFFMWVRPHALPSQRPSGPPLGPRAPPVHLS